MTRGTCFLELSNAEEPSTTAARGRGHGYMKGRCWIACGWSHGDHCFEKDSLFGKPMCFRARSAKCAAFGDFDQKGVRRQQCSITWVICPRQVELITANQSTSFWPTGPAMQCSNNVWCALYLSDRLLHPFIPCGGVGRSIRAPPGPGVFQLVGFPRPKTPMTTTVLGRNHLKPLPCSFIQ